MLVENKSEAEGAQIESLSLKFIKVKSTPIPPHSLPLECALLRGYLPLG